jgi:hypothetical protein
VLFDMAKYHRINLSMTSAEMVELAEMSEKMASKPTATAKVAYIYGMKALKMAFDPKMIGIFEAQLKIKEDYEKIIKANSEAG